MRSKPARQLNYWEHMRRERKFGRLSEACDSVAWVMLRGAVAVAYLPFLEADVIPALSRYETPEFATAALAGLGGLGLRKVAGLMEGERQVSQAVVDNPALLLMAAASYQES